MERFSKNDIIALLGDDPSFNLGESTSRDLMPGESRVFRLGFGFLPPAELGEALTATSEALRASLN